MLLTQYLSVLVHFGTRMNASSFGIKRSKFKVTARFNMLALLMRYPVYYIGLNFTLLSALMHFWDKDERVSVWELKVEGQVHSMTQG